MPHERHMLVVSVSLKLDNLPGQLYYFAKVNVGNCNLVSTSFPPERFWERGWYIYDVTTLFPAYSFLIIDTQGLWKRVFDWGHLLEKLGHHREIESRRFEHQPFDKRNGKFYTCFILLMFSPSQNPCNSSPSIKHATCRFSFVDDSYAWVRPAGFTSFLSWVNGSVLKKPLAAHNFTKYLFKPAV